VPPPLPPEPAIDILTLLPLVRPADRALGRLDGITVLPAAGTFSIHDVRKEAVLSSQVEGTRSTLSDLLRFETEAEGGRPTDDDREVSNYVDAICTGWSG
jgi:Fic family protein